MMDSKNITHFVENNKKLIAVAALAVILLAAFKPTLMQSVSYTTAYEGAKASFYGIYDAQRNKYYTPADRGSASLCQLYGTALKFDPDDPYAGMPNLVGEMTSVMVPLSQSGWIPPDWVPSSWWRDATSWSNPSKVYEWHVKNPGGTYTAYRMEEWKTKWYVSFSAEWDSGPTPMISTETSNQRYRNMDVWFEFNTAPTWYFEKADKAYFAIAKVELSNIEFSAKDPTGQTYSASSTCRTLPMSPGSVLTLYTQPFGQAGSIAPGESAFTAYYYQNTTLNPQYFRDKVYCYVSLLDFGTTEWWDWLALKAKGDVVTMGFTVTQFVVGEWKVKDVGDLDFYGRWAKLASWGWTGLGDFFTAIAQWFANPFNIAGLSAFALLAIAIVTLIVLVYFFGIGPLIRLFRRGDE